ncbi:hypothetical protein HZA99_05970 [Candidatus Woesearchaeota archaeon]|nr:hypothetical protein [Candidatus Woesearchaeota archaeon]
METMELRDLLFATLGATLGIGTTVGIAALVYAYRNKDHTNIEQNKPLQPLNDYDSTLDRLVYQHELSQGQLNHLRGLYVAYHLGKVCTIGNTELDLAQKVTNLRINGKCFIVKVGAQEHTWGGFDYPD